jgi:predicted dehydrogenase
VHDLSILNFLVAEKPSSLIATGVSHTLNNIENIAYITLNYKSGMITHINCSWISPVKIRMILIGGTKKMIVYNDVEPTEKVKVYDTNYQIVEKEKTLVDYRIGDIYIPKFDQTEALKNAADDFIGSIIEGREPFSNGKSAYDIIDILEAAQESIKKNGKEVFLDGNSEYREPKAAGKERKARKRRSPA